jgi:hypothetical protein
VLDVVGGAVQPLMTSSMPLALGDVFCWTGCAARCFVADAEQAALVPWRSGTGGTLVEDALVKIDTTTGLPPRSFGAF